LTFLPTDFIDSEIAKHLEKPEERLGQRLLADSVIELIHGKDSIVDIH